MMRGFRTSSEGPGRTGGQQPSALWAGPFTQVQILQLMKTEFARARRYGLPLSCLLMQVDRLAALCDIHGSELRDKVLTEFGRLVADGTRGSDFLGLISDDRHLLVLPHAQEAQARAVAERVRKMFSKLEVKSKGNVLPLTLSIGLVSCEDKDTLFFDTMLSRSEAALTWAQEAGGDRVEVFRKDIAR